jgi:transposase
MPRCAVALSGLFEHLKGRCTGITILDSSTLIVVAQLAHLRHRVFIRVAARGKSAIGWFYGLALHVAINHHGELPSIKVTPGNVEDRKPVAFPCRKLFGRVYADKGYVARWLVDLLHACQVHFITKVSKNIKPVQHTPFGQARLKRRSLIETVSDELKNLCQVEHTRHRSRANFIVNLMSGIVAYCLMPDKSRLSGKVIRSGMPVIRYPDLELPINFAQSGNVAAPCPLDTSPTRFALVQSLNLFGFK